MIKFVTRPRFEMTMIEALRETSKKATCSERTARAWLEGEFGG